MKKITLLLLFLFISISGYSQLTLEGFENTTGPDATPSTNWTLGTGNWAVFDNGLVSNVRWDINNSGATPPIVYQGVNSAYVNRENIGAGNTSEEYLATPPVLIPANGVLHFYTRMFTSGNQGTIYQIKVAPATASQTDFFAYSLVQQWTEDQLIVPTSNFNIYTEKTVDLSAFATQFVYVSFVKVYTQPDGNLGGDRWLVDNVSIDAACLTPTALTASAITSNSATLNWTNPNGTVTSWEIEVVLASGTPTGVATNTTTTFPYVVTGLLPNTAYKFYVRAICTTGFSSPWSVASANFTTSVAPPVCGGNFVDSGGVGANYANNANVTTTICPTNPGDLVTVTFTAFNTENGLDLLKVYDGNSAAAPLLATLSGTTLPPAYTASSASGCLTFVFTSNATTTAAGWASNVTCAPPPTCRKPTALASNTITSNSVILNWTQPANPDTSVASAWQVLALPCGSPAPTAGSTGFVAAPTNPFTLTGLTSATCYDIYVRAVCSVTDSSTWSSPTTITTQLAPPVCGGNFVDTGGLAANYPNNANQTTTICPVNPGDVVTVTFTSFNTQANTDFLKVYDGNDATATLLATLSGTALPPSFTSSAATGCLTFVFTSNATTTAAGWVSNITCAAPPICRNPTALTSGAVLSTSVILNWTQPANPDTTVASAWHVLALPCGSPAPTAAATGFVTASTNPFTLTGLSPTTCYDIYVRAACSPVDYSTWTGPATITTQVAPPICGGNFVDAAGPTTNYVNNSDSTVTICPVNTGDVVTVTFTSFNTEATWDGLYVFDGNSITAPQIASTNGAGNVPGGLAGSYWGTTIPGPFTSTSATGCLTFRFRSDASGTFPGWVSNVTCAPPPTCLKPISLTATNITSTSALLGWTDTNTTPATQWEVLYVSFGSPIPLPTATGVIVSANPSLITGLNPGTQYTFYVRAVCSSTDSSAWSSGNNFLTLIINDDCSGAIFAPVNSSAVCQQITAGTIIGATASTPGTTAPCIGNADDDVWFQFVATNTYLNISLQNVTGSTTNLNHAVYSGLCGTLTQLYCSAANSLSSVANNLVVGQTYFIRVYSNQSTPQTSNFNLCISTPSTCPTGSTVCSLTDYANTTGVTSLGTIGCLNTSPNPAYFTIQVATTGPINFLLTQSSTAGGAPNLDVDYAAWGPFTSQAAGCAAISGGQAPGIGVPVTQTTGCSYSIAATENLNIANAIAGQFYIVLITNFSNNAGFINLTQTNSTAPGHGSTNCCPDAYFSYSPASYCRATGVSNPIPTIAVGSIAGTFSSTPGLVFVNTATGEIDLLASTAGNYVVTNTVAATASCIQYVKSYTINISEPTTATISYSSPSYCKSVTTLQTVTQTGTPGGSYSAIPNIGLSINPTTGEINPSLSSPGIYTVIYGLPGSVCTTGNPSAQVEIIALPNIVQPAPVAACYTYTLQSIAVGNYFSQTGGVGPLDITVPITSSQTIYIYAVGANGCSNEKSFTVTINTVPTPTNITTTPSSCSPATGTINFTALGTGGPLPSNLFISEVTDATTGSLSYVEIYNGTGAAVNLNNYKIRTFNNGSTTATAGCENVLSGTLNNNSTYVISVGSATNAGGVIPNQVFASCSGVNIDDCIKLTTLTDTVIDIWGRTDGVAFTPLNQPGYSYRRLNTVTVPSTTWNPADWSTTDPEDYTLVGSYPLVVSNYQYSLDSGTFQSGTTFNNLAVGNHTLVVKDLTTGCFSAPVTVTIDPINPISSVTTFTYITPVCQNATSNPFPDTSATGFTTGGTFTSNPATGIDINATTGEITLSNTIAGTYIITYAVAFNSTTCQAASSTSFTIVINPIVNPILGFSYTTPICQNAQATLSPTFAAGFTTGGAFSSTVGLSLNVTTGVIDLATSTAGSYAITYASNASVPSCLIGSTYTFNIIINPVITPVTSFSYNTPFCSSDTLQLPTLSSGFTTGGTFSSTTGLSINGTTGEINVQTSTPGVYTITYAIGANTSTCQVAGTNSTQVTIIPPVTIELTGGCQSVSYILTATPVNGSFVPETATYSWHNAAGAQVGNTQSITVTEVGVYTVTITVDGCSTVSTSFNVDSVFCIIQKGISVNNDGLNDTFDLTGYDVKKLTIFNRLGMKVYSRNNYVDEWGGKSDDGDELPDGTYYFIIDRNSGDTKTGWIYINRAQ